MVSDAVDEESKDEQDGKTSSQAVEDQNVRFCKKHGRAAVNSQGGTVSSALGHIGVPAQPLVVFLALNPAAGTK